MSSKLNLGCGNDIIPGFVNVDVNGTDPRIIPMSVEKFIVTVDDSCVDFVKAHHVLEHVVDLDFVMKEIHRVCIKKAKVDIVVPLANTLWAVANPDHKRVFNHRTFQYYTEDFQTSDLGLFREFRIVSQKIEREPNEWFDGIEWLVANLHVILEVVK